MNCYLDANTKWMVALATLSAGQETALRTEAETPTHHTHVLGKNTSSVSPSNAAGVSREQVSSFRDYLMDIFFSISCNNHLC